MDLTRAAGAATGPPIFIAEVVVCLEAGLADDVCQLQLERRELMDVVVLRYTEFTNQDRSIEFPTVRGDDQTAAAAALFELARRGRIQIDSVRRGGILNADEVSRIAAAGDAAWRADRDEMRRQTEDAERRNPSRILAAARQAGLGPEPVGGKGQWRTHCPGTNHALMISTTSETFGCGYCRIRGGPDDLIEFAAGRHR